MARATASFEVKSWDEKPCDERDGLPKLTHASVRQSLTGDIEGEGAVEFLMAYRADGSADITAIQRVVGRIGGKSGSFVLMGSGSYERDSGIAQGTWTVVPDSGTGELRTLRGQGEYFARKEPRGSLTLEYELA